MTSHQNFTDDVSINLQIKEGAWRDLHSDGITVDELREVIQEQYALDDAVVDRIEFQYKTKIGNKGNSKMVSIFDGGSKLEGEIRTDDGKRQLTVQDLNIRVRYRRGDMIATECSCDSAYMLSAMDRVGKSIREAYHWIPPSEKCYLVMDNAGGHGTDDAIEKYIKMLDEKYNITTIFQIPRSPYTNVLDLGVWCSLQARVEKTHFNKRCEVNALSRSVYDTWNHGHLDDMITRVFDRLRNVLVLICEAKGKNDLVEQNEVKILRSSTYPST